MRMVWGTALLWGTLAVAAPSSLTVAAGDCKNPELISAATSFGQGAITGEAVLERFRPLPTVSAEDLARQLETVQAQFYAGTLDKALEGLNQALAGIARLSPRAEPWKLTHRALMLQAMIQKAANKTAASNDAQKRILRIEPQFKLDADYYTPATIQAFEALRKEVVKAKKAKLTIASTPSGAQVFLDGALVGKTPFAGEYPQGDYRLMLAGTGDRFSFVRDVTLSRDQAIQVDLQFEGALAVPAPLCLTTEPAQLTDAALRLAALAGADTVAVVKLDARNAEPGWVSAILLDVNKGTKIREGGVRFTGAKRGQAVRDLAVFVHTGTPASGVVVAGSVPPLQPDPVAPAPEPAPTAAVEPPPPAPVVAQSSPDRGRAPRISSLVLMGVGLVTAGVGAGLYATGGTDRAALQTLVDDQGRLKAGANVQEAKGLQARIDAGNTNAIAVGAAGGVVLLTGAVLFFLLPPSPDGSGGGLSFSF